MSIYCLNPLSANEQCHSHAQIADAVRGVIKCIEHLLPAIRAKRALVIYDWRIEGRELQTGERLSASIASLRTTDRFGGDLARLWYSYMKNHAKKASDDSVELRVTAMGVQEALAGQAALELLDANKTWISLAGTAICEKDALNVNREDSPQVTVPNVFDTASLVLKLPKYEPSPKHRKTAYWDAARGEMVAPMAIEPVDAAKLLLISVEFSNDRWAYCEATRTFVRFKITHADQRIYHGFQVGEAEVPPKAFALLASG
jgi:hypothetical protein